MNASEPKTDRIEAAHAARAVARDLGFGLVGITDARPTERPDFVRHWIADGKHGEMDYLAKHLDVRLDPDRLLEGVQSVIAVADAYPSEAEPARAPHAASDAPHGKVARYAWGDDYHKVIKKRLHRLADTLNARFPGHHFRATVDTAPALEREYAARAGLGWTGKHTLTLHPHHGSYTLLGLVLTTLDLQSSREADWPDRTAPPADHCGTCTRCIDACPTHCITSDPSRGSPDPRQGRSIDATRCISYLTLEHRSPIDSSLHEAMGTWIAGCDICQEVCPFNARGEGGKELPLPIHPRYRPRERFVEGLPLLEVLGWTEEDRREAFVASALKRVKLDMLKRNALIAAGNHLREHEDAALQERVETIATDQSEAKLVRETARQVLHRLRGDAPSYR